MKEDPPLTPAQRKWVTDVLETSDKIDILFKNGVTDSRQYYDAALRVEDKYFENKDLLNAQDFRAVFLANTVKAYQEACTMKIGDEAGRYEDQMYEALGKAKLNKSLLRKVKDGTSGLSAEERKFVDDLRRQWGK